MTANMSAVERIGSVQAVARRASPIINTINGVIREPTPGAPVLATPIMNAENAPRSHCHSARSGMKGWRGFRSYAAFWILPLLMQLVHTRTRLAAPLIEARTSCKLIFQRRLVILLAWLMRLPNRGPRPHTSHTFAI